MDHIFLAGASRGVGREIAHLLAGKTSVKALLRSPNAQSELEAMGLKVAIGDALNLAAVQDAMQSDPVWAVISTIGGLPKEGERADYLGNKNLIEAAVNVGVQKFILISSLGTGNTKSAIPPQAYEALKEVLAEKEKAEQALVASGLTYTIIRPGGLVSEPATGNGVLTADPTIAGSVHRADVAALAYQCLFSEKANNQVLSAVDRHKTYTQQEFEVFDLG